MAFAVRASPAATGLRPLAPAARRSSVRVVCQANKEQQQQTGVVGALALPVATLVATAMLTGAAMPEQALAASSGGRTGGSSGFKARKVAPASSSVSTSRTTVVNNTVVMAPPVVAPPLFGGFGFGGFSIMPTFVMPVPFFGGILQFFFLLFAISAVASIVRALTSGNKNNSKKDDGWGDL